jgi:hypothetical protein
MEKEMLLVVATLEEVLGISLVQIFMSLLTIKT